jgi:16S rRNA processing protein RimM
VKMGTSQATSIYLGSFVKPFGIKGELKFVGSDDFWSDVLRSKRLELHRWVDDRVERRPAVIERSRPHGNNYVVKLEGVDDRDGAELEVGGELFIDSDVLDVDLPDRELPYQVVGRMVKTEDGRVVGSIKSMLFSAAHPVYVVDSGDGEVMIPAVPEFVVARDNETGEITIRPIPGLFEE